MSEELPQVLRVLAALISQGVWSRYTACATPVWCPWSPERGGMPCRTARALRAHAASCSPWSAAVIGGVSQMGLCCSMCAESGWPTATCKVHTLPCGIVILCWRHQPAGMAPFFFAWPMHAMPPLCLGNNTACTFLPQNPFASRRLSDLPRQLPLLPCRKRPPGVSSAPHDGPVLPAVATWAQPGGWLACPPCAQAWQAPRGQGPLPT